MRTEIKYVELKSGFSGNGPAWIGLVSFSKSGKTIYFDGKAFQRMGSARIQGNFMDIISGDEYWISGVKKDLSDRHRFGGGKVFVEKRILSEYLKIIGQTELPKTDFILTEVSIEIPVERLNEIENEKLNPKKFSEDLYQKEPFDLTDSELSHLISELIYDEENAKFNKGRRSIKKRRIELERELGKREIKNVG